MNNYDLEHLRSEMVNAFYEYVAADRLNTPLRLQAWDRYCERRELFLEVDCAHHGKRYVHLRETMLDTSNASFGSRK